MAQPAGLSRPFLVDNPADPPFMGRIHDGPQEAHGDGFYLFRGEFAQRGIDVGFIQRGDDVADVVYSFADLFDQAAGCKGGGTLALEVEAEPVAADPGDGQCISESLGSDETGAGTFAFQ